MVDTAEPAESAQEKRAKPMLRAPMCLECIEYRDRLPGGVTKPMLVVARDQAGALYTMVLKVKHPASQDGHFGPTSLACELICSVLCRALELNVPDYAIIEVPRSFPQRVRPETERRLLQSNVGSNFGTLYHEGKMRVQRDDLIKSSEMLRGLLEDVIAFDATVMNGDRKSSNSNL